MRPAQVALRKWTRAVGAISAIVSVIGLARLALLAPAHAQPASQPAVTIQLTGKTPVVGDTGVFDIRADVVDPSRRSDLDVAVAVYQRITDRTALLDSIEGLRLGSPISLKVRPLGDGVQSGTRIISERIIVGSCEECLDIPTDGVYPVSIDIRQRSEGTVAARLITHLVLQRNASPTLSVALILPTTVPRTLLPDGSYRVTPLTRLVAAGESLASRPGIPLSVLVTPAMVDRGSADDTIRGSLDTLGSGLGGREIIATPYEAVHPRLVQDGRLGEVIRGQWRAGSDSLVSRFGDSVIADTWVVGPSDRLPDRDGLLKIGPQRLLVHGSHVAEVGADGPGKAPDLLTAPVVFDTGLVFQRRSDGTLVQEEALEESSAINAIVTDATLTGHLIDRPSLLGVNDLVADLAIASERSQAAAGLAVWVPDEAVTRSVVDALLAGIGSLKSIQPVKLTELFDRPIAADENGEFRSIGRIAGDDVDASNEYLDYLASIDDARRTIDGVNLTLASNANAGSVAERYFSAALADPNAASPAAGSTDPIFSGSAYLATSSRLAERALSGVRLTSGGPFRLTALRGRIPVTIENLTGGTATVHLSVEQGRVRSTPASAEQDVVVEPGSQVLLLDVETRSSGSFDVRVSLTTPNGVALSRNAYKIRSTGVSGVGVTLTLTLLGLLILWWLSNRAKHGGTGPRRLQRRQTQRLTAGEKGGTATRSSARSSTGSSTGTSASIDTGVAP